MAIHHIVNGDCLADQLRQTKINENFIICRECLIEGNVDAHSLSDFWKIRAAFLADTYKISVEEYFSRTVSEFEKLNNLPENSEVCLWFENDLFCQTNMWFVISLLAKYPSISIFRIFPRVDSIADTWKGFGMATPEQLEQAYLSKIKFSSRDIELGVNLWNAYQVDDFEKLKEWSKSKSDCFAFLEEVCQAHIDRFPMGQHLGRPDRAVKEIIDNTSTEFEVVLSAFSEREGIYGFGDLQVRNIYARLMRSD